jgi:hypothetical protein
MLGHSEEDPKFQQ